MIEIEALSTDSNRPYLNLVPLVDFLLAGGNDAIDGGFLLNPDGWRCRMSKSIDLESVRKAFVLPAAILLSDAYDSVLDRSSWCVIEGPGAQT